MGRDRSASQSAGVRTFSTTKYHFDIDFGQVANTIEVQQFDVTNSDANTSQVMLGYKMPKAFVYDYDGTDVTDRTADVAAGQVTLGADGKIIIGSPVPIHSIEFDVDTAGGALSAKRYYNGAITTLNPAFLETADITSTGIQSETFLLPNDQLPLPADHALVTAGVTPGLYIYQADIASSAIIDSIKVYHFVQSVETVASGATLTNDITLSLPAGAQPACYVSNADAANAVNVLYRLK